MQAHLRALHKLQLAIQYCMRLFNGNILRDISVGVGRVVDTRCDIGHQIYITPKPELGFWTRLTLSAPAVSYRITNQPELRQSICCARGLQ